MIWALVIGDSLAESRADLIVHYVCGRGMILIGSNVVCIFFGGKGLDNDDIATLECDHDALVATAGSGVKVPSVIHKKLGDK